MKEPEDRDSGDGATESTDAPRSFEDAFEVAEQAADRLERGELSLEDCLEEYQRGARGLRDCYRLLEEARRKLEVFESQAESPGGDDEASAWRPARPDGPLADVLRRLGEEPDPGAESGGPGSEN